MKAIRTKNFVDKTAGKPDPGQVRFLEYQLRSLRDRKSFLPKQIDLLKREMDQLPDQIRNLEKQIDALKSQK